jgi:uncharacterized repeat protein (TIGR03803 family)
MPSQALSALRSLAATLAVLLIGATVASAQEQVLYSFSDSSGSVLPEAGVISDASGNLYGVTFYSGTYGMGTVYKLTRSGNTWQENILHSFNIDGVDGFFPTGKLVFDSAGNLYGTTQYGGTGNCSNGLGCGTAFRLSPTGDGSWTETILHDFLGSDGWQVYAGLTFDSAGNLYGTTVNGGAFGWGTLYELSPKKNGAWTFHQLHQFSGAADGAVPWGGVIVDADSNIFGVASQGGGVSTACPNGCGVAFELVHNASGKIHWSGKVLHNFTAKSGDGHFPTGALMLDAAGNLYGTASQGGGAADAGIVFELTPSSNGSWKEKVLHNFNSSASDGVNPSASLIWDSAGNLYSTTLSGGSGGEGTVFELTPGNGKWTETILHNFTVNDGDGNNPSGGVLMDASGNLFGVTDGGGTSLEGAVYEIVR